MLPNRVTETDCPRQASDVKWRKTTEEGENEKGDRTQRGEKVRENGETQEEQ